MEPSRIVSLTTDPTRVRAEDGSLLTPPEGWSLLLPGDAGLTRRVKAAGPTWTVIEKRGRKKFSRGVWAPTANIESARQALEQERSTPAYARRRAGDVRRREATQSAYVEDFCRSVREFLAFSPTYRELEGRLADAVTEHATPVGSGTVARTKRISVERRAEAAVIAWLRHQTTAYEGMRIARIKGERRRVRRELAQVSRTLLDCHRSEESHDAGGCLLCRAFEAA
jgi:hypothetical protein